MYIHTGDKVCILETRFEQIQSLELEGEVLFILLEVCV